MRKIDEQRLIHNNCGTCYYFEVWRVIRNGSKIYQGTCHRYPPFNAIKKYTPESSDNFPIVTTLEWCGEYKKLKKHEKQEITDYQQKKLIIDAEEDRPMWEEKYIE